MVKIIIFCESVSVRTSELILNTTRMYPFPSFRTTWASWKLSWKNLSIIRVKVDKLRHLSISTNQLRSRFNKIEIDIYKVAQISYVISQFQPISVVHYRLGPGQHKAPSTSAGNQKKSSAHILGLFLTNFLHLWNNFFVSGHFGTFLRTFSGTFEGLFGTSLDIFGNFYETWWVIFGTFSRSL